MIGDKKKQCRKRRYTIGPGNFKNISDIPILKLPPHFKCIHAHKEVPII